VRNRFVNKSSDRSRPVTTFGTVKNGQIILNKAGMIVKKQWQWLPAQYSHIYHDEWIIMPDHIHGIITIKQMGNEVYIDSTGRINGIDCNNTCRDRSRPVPTGTDTNIIDINAYNETDTDVNINVIPKIKPLDQIIGAFKTTSSKLIHQSGNTSFAWQRSYYDHIIRDQKSLHCIRKYIKNNPFNLAIDNAYDGRICNILNGNNDIDGENDDYPPL